MGLIMKEFKIVTLLIVVVIAGCSEQKRDFASEVSSLDFTLLLEGRADQGGYSDELVKLTGQLSGLEQEISQMYERWQELESLKNS